MRRYYVYRQKAELIDGGIWFDYGVYKWKPYELLFYVEGTRKLYDVLNGSKIKGYRGTPLIGDSFCYDTKSFKIPWSIYTRNIPSKERFLVIDDKGRIRDYTELTSKYKKKKNHCRSNGAYQVNWLCHYIGDRRKSITPDEVREIKDEYGITMREIKPKRKLDSWNMREDKKISRSWKKQSKRKKQWK